MTDIKFRSDSTVELIDHMGDDRRVVRAARVSHGNDLDKIEDQSVNGLINYLIKNRHGSPCEKGVFEFRVETPIFVAREFMRHRMMCLPASALIPVGTEKTIFQKPIGKIYEDWKLGMRNRHGSGTEYRAKLPCHEHPWTRTLNLETGLVERARMEDIYEAGIKPIVRIELTSGHVLRCTREHRVWTSEGWQQAGNLTKSALVARTGKVVTGDPLGIPRRLREGIQFWASERKRELVQPVDECYLCNDKFSYDELDLDHEIPVVKDLARALDITNLKPACKKCHRGKTNREQALSRRRQQVLGARYEQVVSVTSDGEEMTYDISMPAPWHNFIADGVVVHNSFNEESARYKQLDPVFWVPAEGRAMTQKGKPGHYSMLLGTPDQYGKARLVLEGSARRAYEDYEYLLSVGIAREVARACLPVAIYTSFYVTCNARSLMNFLSLRVDSEDATFPSKPQAEIEEVAVRMEEFFCQKMPVTHSAFVANGRVAP